MGAITIVAWLGSRMAGLTAGELTAFMFYAVMAGGAVATISEVIGEAQKAAGASERMRELLHTRSHVQQLEAPDVLPDTVLGQLIRPCQFQLPLGSGITVLSDITQDINPGERIALVGPGGAGNRPFFSSRCASMTFSKGAS